METHLLNSNESQSLKDDQDQTIIEEIYSGYSEDLACGSTGACQLKVSTTISQTELEFTKQNSCDFGRQPGTLVDQKVFENTSPRANENPVLTPSQQQTSHPAYIYTCK